MTYDMGEFEPHIAARLRDVQASEIRELLKVAEAPGVISFGGGIPDPTLFPREEIAAIAADVLADPERGARALQYSTSEGDPDLRRWIADHMTAQGCPCTPDNILVTAGAQQALDFLGRLLIDENDQVHCAAPTYLGALQAFAPNRPRYVPLGPGRNSPPIPGTGRDAMAYVVPDFANPTGETMDGPARDRLLAEARARQMVVIEDSPYAALRFEGEAPDPLLARDIAVTGHIDQSRVVHLGSFSKVLTPGLRVGWVCAAQSIIRRLVLLKQASDLNAPRLNQMIVLELARTRLPDQIARARSRYREKRDAMMAALAAEMPDGVTWSRPEGGMFIWLTLPSGLDAAALLPRAIEAGVAYVPGAAFYPARDRVEGMRLSYSLPTNDAIHTGVARLGAVLRDHVSRQ